MRNFLKAAGAIMAASSTAVPNAGQADHIRSDGNGGFYNSNGSHTRSDGNGGFYHSDGSHTRSDGNGGFYRK